MTGGVRFGSELRATHFPDMDGDVYLDTPTQGVPPRAAVAALTAQVAAWAAGKGDHALWNRTAEDARRRLAALTGRPVSDVALVASQAAAATVVARQLPAATVVVPEAEFRSNLLPWTTSRPADRVRAVPHPATTEAICAVIDRGADLVAVSSVQASDGLRVDLPALVSHAHRRGALVYVDASQSLGVDEPLLRCGADFIAAVGYKWLLGTRGATLLLVAPEQQDRLGPYIASGETARDGSSYGLDYLPYDDARRFDQPPDWFSWIASAAAVEVLHRYEAAELDAHATGLAERFRTGAIDLGHAVGPRDIASPIVKLPHPDPAPVVRDLAAAGVRAATRAGGIRFGFHLYNDEPDVTRALEALAGLRIRRS